MNAEELKIKVDNLIEELFNCQNIGAVIGGLKQITLENALNGRDDKALKIINDFFESRERAFSVYTEEQQEIIKRFEKRVAEKGSVGNALQGTSISSSVISGLRKATYNGAVDKKFRELKDFLDLKDEKLKVYSHNIYVPTSISENVYENIRTAHISGVCIMVTGDAGIGKTVAAMRYISDYPGKAIVITATEPRTNKSAMLQILASELKIDLSSTARAMHSQKILSELNDGTVIIVDEAQNFNFDAIDTLRGFADYFKNKNLGTVGIVCMGNDIFRQRFFGKSGVGKEQVWNRFVERPKYESKNILYSDINLLFPALAEKGMEKELKFLYSVALSPKEDIRSAVHLFTTVYNKYNGDCSLENLVKQAKRMQIDLSDMKSIIDRIKTIKG